ncbi:MAG: sporulation protein YqfD [Paenibacillaceae bacterium]|nr:sporulation protein YqfD [Paenibacillaceae bacterium]
MQPLWLRWIRGYAAIDVRGAGIEALINAAYGKRMDAWDIRRNAQGVTRMNVSLRDYFRLRPLLKRTGCRMRTTGRHGLPFLLAKLWRRKAFVLGGLLFVVGLYMLSSLVWDVKVEGATAIDKDRVLQIAKDEGIYRMQWKFRLRDADTLSRELQSKLPEASWVTIEVHGTRVVIKIVETTKPDARELRGPRDIVAAHDALVTAIYAEKGKPLAQPNKYVRKGDVLISGVIGTDLVAATGKVKGIVWYRTTASVPLQTTYRTYTGESFTRRYLVMGGRAMKIAGYDSPVYEQQTVEQERKIVQFHGIMLPIGWLKDTVRETETTTREVAAAEAEQAGLRYAEEQVLKGAGTEAAVIGKSVLKRATENGEVTLNVLFEVEQSIGIEQSLAPAP